MADKQYAERDIMDLDISGNHYSRHISAMTREGLHSKSDIAAELAWRDARIAELESIRAAAEKLVRCKGRYNSEQNYRAMAALFGVTTPDLPPFDDIRNEFEAAWSSIGSGNRPARSHVDGQDYAGSAAEFAWKWWQRSAGIKLESE